jgi:hypothetical protein
MLSRAGGAPEGVGAAALNAASLLPRLEGNTGDHVWLLGGNPAHEADADLRFTNIDGAGRARYLWM